MIGGGCRTRSQAEVKRRDDELHLPLWQVCRWQSSARPRLHWVRRATFDDVRANTNRYTPVGIQLKITTPQKGSIEFRKCTNFKKFNVPWTQEAKPLVSFGVPSLAPGTEGEYQSAPMCGGGRRIGRRSVPRWPRSQWASARQNAASC